MGAPDDIAAIVRKNAHIFEHLLAEVSAVRVREHQAMATALSTTIETLVFELGHNPKDPVVRAIIRRAMDAIG